MNIVSTKFWIRAVAWRKLQVSQRLLTFFGAELARDLNRIRNGVDFDRFFDHLLEAGKSCVLGRYVKGIENTPDTTYARWLRERVSQVFVNLVHDHPLFRGNLQAAFVEGSAGYSYAVPLHKLIEGKLLPARSAELLRLFYLWIFANPPMTAALAGTRFFGNQFSSDIDLRLFFFNTDSLSKDEISKTLREALTSRLRFCPMIEIKLRRLDALEMKDFLHGRCVYGRTVAVKALRKILPRQPFLQLAKSCEAAISKLVVNLNKPKHLADFLDPAWLQTGIEVVKLLNSDKEGFLVKRPPETLHQHLWHARNAKFFQSLAQGDFDRLLVEDATGALNDKKGFDKDMAFIILNVHGLEKNGEIISSDNVVLKIRGIFPNKRGLDAHMDLIKEYSAYIHLHKMLPGCSYFPAIGPLVLRLDKIDLDVPSIEVRSCSGFFMENVRVSGMKSFTMRIYKPSHIGRLYNLVAKARDQANRHGVRFQRRELWATLFKLAITLWRRGVQITKCDLSIFFDDAHRISKVVMFDFERLSFARLTGEYHIVLPALIDIKTLLPKRGEVRTTVLKNLYGPLEGNRFNQMDDVLVFLDINARWLSWKHKIHRFFYTRPRLHLAKKIRCRQARSTNG